LAHNSAFTRSCKKKPPLQFRIRPQAIAAFKEAGLDELNTWCQDTWAEARKSAADLGL
jgi:hypothetical protein